MNADVTSKKDKKKRKRKRGREREEEIKKNEKIKYTC